MLEISIKKISLLHRPFGHIAWEQKREATRCRGTVLKTAVAAPDAAS